MAFYKYGQIYRQVITLPELEVCYTMKNIQNSHPIVQAAVDAFGESLAPVLKGCPYFGDYNVTIEVNTRELPSIFPSGMYKVEVYLRVSGNKTAWIVAQGEIVSSIKTSF